MPYSHPLHTRTHTYTHTHTHSSEKVSLLEKRVTEISTAQAEIRTGMQAIQIWQRTQNQQMSSLLSLLPFSPSTSGGKLTAGAQRPSTSSQALVVRGSRGSDAYGTSFLMGILYLCMYACMYVCTKSSQALLVRGSRGSDAYDTSFGWDICIYACMYVCIVDMRVCTCAGCPRRDHSVYVC